VGLATLFKSWINLRREHSLVNIIFVFVDEEDRSDASGMWIRSEAIAEYNTG
jgi:hypothetical protein